MENGFGMTEKHYLCGTVNDTLFHEKTFIGRHRDAGGNPFGRRPGQQGDPDARIREMVGIGDENGKKYKGGKTYTIDVPLDRLPRFTMQNSVAHKSLKTT